MTPEQKQFVDYMTGEATTHEQWVFIMQFGMATLLKDQSVMIELVFKEAAREVERKGYQSEQTASEAHRILEELGLQIVMAD